MKNLLIQIEKLSFFVSAIEEPILDNINYNVFEEDFVIILGSNGSGKSTLLKLIDKRNQPKDNEILFKTKDINKINNKDYFNQVKTLTQNCNDSLFPSLTLFENFSLYNKGSKFKERKNNNEREFLKEYLFSFNPKLSLKLDQIVDELSGGEKQTLALALTFLNPPDLLLLDEHTSALDPKTAALNMQLTQELVLKNKITCLLTTHNLQIAEQYGNRILVLQHGKLLRTVEPFEKRSITHEQMLHMFY